MIRYSGILFTFPLLLLPFLSAQEKKPIIPEKKPIQADKKNEVAWSVDDIVNAESVSSLKISPDGKYIVWIKKEPDKDSNKYIGHLMLTHVQDGQEVQLTRAHHSCSDPDWSPDGKRIAFLSDQPSTIKAKRKLSHSKKKSKDEEDHTQIWLINPFGGEPWTLTESTRDVQAFAWKDNETIFYTAKEKKGRLESELGDKKDDTEVVDDETNEPPVRLWKIHLEDKKSERFSNNKDRIQSLSISPDGKYAVTVHDRSLSYPFDHKIKPAVFLYDLEKQEGKQIFPDKFNIARVYWQQDSKGFYAINQFTTHPRYLMAYVEEVYHYQVEDQKLSRIDLKWEKGLADSEEGFAVTPNGFVALLANGVRHKAMRFVKEGSAWKGQEFEVSSLQTFHMSQDGKSIVFQESTATSPPKWLYTFLEGEKKEPRVLIDLHSDLRKKKMAKTELFRWKGALNEEVEGLVSYPHDYQAGKKYPMVVLIHGGPFWADFDHWDERWAYVRNLLCSRGAFVFRPNYHGSSHYGLAWAESIQGRYYLPVEDIEKGIDALTQQKPIDAGKIGLGGWSNGAILIMSLITRRHYQAASAGAGGSEWSADWGVCDFGMSFSNYYIGKSPFEDPELYRKNAPFYDFNKVKTPTILFHGSEDKDVPTHHSWYQFRALREVGKADVRFLLFPGEKHGLEKISHRRRKVEEELAWFDKYLFQTIKPTNIALKDDSPLAHKLALQKAARQGRLYGESKNGILVPETVLFKDIQIGRFEVTRAQYAQFDEKYIFEPAAANYPASGLTFDQANSYCAWLSKKTGQKYRLGTLAEMESIYEEGSDSENTLDHWAGYSPNPEDLAKLRASLKELAGRAPLLKEVGSFKSADPKIAIFDLGGNVAEWVNDQGKGKVLGGSADLPAEEKTPCAQEYIGFRVVRE